MKIRFRRFEAGDAVAVDRFNERLRSAGLPHVVGGETPEAPRSDSHEPPIVERMFVATDGEEVRGAVWLREQLFDGQGGAIRAGWMIYPVSESLIEPRFAGVPATLLFGLLREQPRLMALGMGGDAGPFARMLTAARWQSLSVPFLFLVRRPARVLRRLAIARETWPRRRFGDVVAGSGLAWLGHGLAVGLRSAMQGAGAALGVAREVEHFGSWADALWNANRMGYGFVAARSARFLNTLYPEDLLPLSRLRVQRDGKDVGWACAQAFAAKGTWLEAQFGDLRVGVITDAFADPRNARVILGAGLRRLAAEDVDLVVTNLTHPAWCAAARRSGFWPGPSILTFSFSPAAAKAIGDLEGLHLTRSDGDGPQGNGETR